MNKLILICLALTIVAIQCKKEMKSDRIDTADTVSTDSRKIGGSPITTDIPAETLIPSPEIPVLEMTTWEQDIDSLLDTARSNFVTLGQTTTDDSSMVMYYKPRRGIFYHVISPWGNDMFKPGEIRAGREPHCEGDTMDVWYVKCDGTFLSDPRVREHYPIGIIIIGSADTGHFNPPVIDRVPDSIQDFCRRILQIDSLQIDTTTGETVRNNIEIIAAGIKNTQRRILVNCFSMMGKSFIAVMETDGSGYKALFKTRPYQDEKRYYCGQADMNGDGFSDVFLFNFGDYGGFNFIMERNGKWIVIHNHGPQAC